MNVAIIPARGGSKRIPRKNIKPFCGKPMIGWSIEAAVQSGLFDRIIVSTDDEEIAAVSRRCGAEVPFMRPSSLADDHTGTVEVIQHAVGWLDEQHEKPDIACCIYATAPLIAVADLSRGLDVLRETGSRYAFSVAPYPSPIQRAFRITDDGRAQMFWPENFELRSQDLESAFHDAGQFYWGHADAWLEGITLFSAASAPVALPLERVQDIDTPDDWARAELLFRAYLDRKS